MVFSLIQEEAPKQIKVCFSWGTATALPFIPTFSTFEANPFHSFRFVYASMQEGLNILRTKHGVLSLMVGSSLSEYVYCVGSGLPNSYHVVESLF